MSYIATHGSHTIDTNSMFRSLQLRRTSYLNRFNPTTRQLPSQHIISTNRAFEFSHAPLALRHGFPIHEASVSHLYGVVTEPNAVEHGPDAEVDGGKYDGCRHTQLSGGVSLEIPRL